MLRRNQVSLLVLVVFGILISIASVLGQHPLKADTDGDGMPDGWEIEHGLNPNDAGDANIDYNDNGLTNHEEHKNGYDPWDEDTDEDGVSNYAESTGLFGFFTDPLAEDTDEDDVSDLQEICRYIDISNKTEMDEIFPNNTDRGNAKAEIISMCDTYLYKSDPTNSDTDYDGLSDGDEYSKSTNPTCVDSDYDGIHDGDEVYVYKTDPALRDTDEDGLWDSEEIFGTYGVITDPTNEDTDGDGISDGEECLSFGRVPIAPSRYVLSYEDFISGNEYVNETITLKARVATIKYDTAQTNYSIFLKPLGTDTPTQGGLGVARIHSSWHYDLEYGMMHVDDRFGFSLYAGDTIVMVGKAGRIRGSYREIEVDSAGKLYLVLTPEEARERWLPYNGYVKRESKLKDITPVPTPTATPTSSPEPSPTPTATPASLEVNEMNDNGTANATAPNSTSALTPESMDERENSLIGLLGYGVIVIVIVVAAFVLYTKFGDRIPLRKWLKKDNDEVPLPDVKGMQNAGTRKEWN
jgi:hypothetical protein